MHTLIRLLFVEFLTVSCIACAEDLTSNPRHRELSTDKAHAESRLPQAGLCQTGIFRKHGSTFLALTKASRGFDYTFSDGMVGNTLDANSPVVCRDAAVLVRNKETWPRATIVETDTRFESNGISLAGRLIEPTNADKHTPLVVYAHGSEDGAWIDHGRDPYQMVGRGVSVFVYDKRGTGLSQGNYTQNFPILANDLVAASHEAKRLAAARYGRFGLIGLSQGGWIAPLAAARAKADFLGIGYGLAVDIAEEDAAQVTKELEERGYGTDVFAKARMVTDITARIVKSAYKDGLDDLDSIKKRFEKEPWFSIIKGAYTGVLLSIPVSVLRSDGVPHLDKFDVDWSQDPMRVLRALDVPQLWAFANEDRQAPISLTVERLQKLRDEGKNNVMFIFPNTEHGMWRYEQASDFSRKHTNVTPRFYDLMADWAKGRLRKNYGQSYRR
ncbi:alpha/beta hydrolase family protein [Undibacterium flavidum]|uniref:Alpha/beta hydrolase n=1 Tax=Undibacterium flavidum TaxID=2762297 RepID=A0ABR6YGB5_9BURK|nr:alpha/beta hydrolase [Undibacterium flavidum]MBC3875568.1 alpha/beta hydrolase [Undibacterium flavidum]